MCSKHLGWNAPAILAGWAILIVCPLADAQTLSPIGQRRAVTTWAFDHYCQGDDCAEDRAIDFEPFDSAVQSVVACAMSTSEATADQQSRIDPSSLTAAGSSRVFCEAWIANSMFGVGSSIFEVSFELYALSAFSLTGELRATALGDIAHVVSEVRVRLSDHEGATIFEYALVPEPDNRLEWVMLDEFGVLSPGVYTLRAVTDTAAHLPEDPFSGQAEASFDLSFEVILCPGDLDHDGVIGLSDLSTLLANYGTTGGATYEDGDIDGDGDIDLSDLSILLSVYGATCP